MLRAVGTVAKMLAACSFLFAALVVCNVVYTFGVTDWSDAGEETLGGLSASIVLAILLAQVGFALLLSTVGAAAWCVGEMADQAATAAHVRRARWDASQTFDASVRR